MPALANGETLSSGASGKGDTRLVKPRDTIIHEDFGTFKKGFREIGSVRVLLNERPPKKGVYCFNKVPVRFHDLSSV